MKRKIFNFYLIGTLFLSFALSFVSCSDDYDDQIDDLKNEINSLKSLLESSTNKVVANVSVNGSVITVSYTDGSSDTLDTKGDVEQYSLKIVDGVLQLVTDGSGSGSVTLPVPEFPVVELPEYTIKLEGNVLTLLKDGIPAGQVTLPETDDSGSVIDLPTAADFTVEDGYLCYKGDPTGVYLLGSDATAPELKIVPEDGKYVIYQDGVAIDGFIPMAEFEDGILKVMGIEVDLNNLFNDLLPEDASVVIYQKDDEGNVVGASIKVGDETITLPIAHALEGLIFVPNLYVEGVGTVRYNTIKLDNGVELSNSQTLTFRTNHSSANISGIDWTFLNRAVEFGTRAEVEGELITIIGDVTQNTTPYSSISIETKGNIGSSQADASKNKYDVVNLKATAAGKSNIDGDVVSDDVQVLFHTYHNVEIANKQKMDNNAAIGTYVFTNLKTQYEPTSYTPDFTVSEYTVVNGKRTFYLKNYVLAVLDKNDNYATPAYGTNSQWDLVELDELGFSDYTWTFEAIDYTPAGSNQTNQNSYVSLEGSVVTVLTDYSSIDRTPVFKATLSTKAGGELASHFIKFKLDNSVVTEPAPHSIALPEINYLDLYLGNWYKSTESDEWALVNQAIYEELGMSHNQFVEAYIVNGTQTIDWDRSSKIHKAEYYPYGIQTLPDEGFARFNTESSTGNTSTAILELQIDPQTCFGEHTWVVVLSSNIANREVEIEVNFNVLAPTHPEFERSYVNVNGDVATVNGQIKNGQFTFDAVMAESFKVTSWKEFNDNVAPYADNIISYNDNRGGTYFTSAANGESALTGTISNTGDHNTQEITTSKIDVPERFYNVVLRSTFANNGVLETPWVYRFVNPLDVKLEEFSLNTYINGDPDEQEIYKLLSVTVLKDAIYTNGTKNSNNYSKYGINGESWSINYNNSGVATDDKLYFDNILSPTEVIWNNDGTRLLQNNTDAKLEVTVDTDYATATQSATITLLKTD